MGVVLARQVCTKVLEKCEKTQGDLDAVWKDEEFVALATDGVIALWQNKAFANLNKGRLPPELNQILETTTRSPSESGLKRGANRSTQQQKRSNLKKPVTDQPSQQKRNHLAVSHTNTVNRAQVVWPSDCIRELVKKCQDCPELFFHRTGVDGKLTEHYGYAIHKYLDNLENDQNVGVVQRRYGLRQCYRLQKRLGQHPHDTLARYIVQQDPNITFAQARQRCHDRALAGKKYDRYVTLFDNPGILFVLPYDKPPTFYERTVKFDALDAQAKELRDKGIDHVGRICSMAGEKVTAVGDRMLSEWLEKTQFEEPQPLKWGNAIKSWPSQLKRKRKPGSASNETTRLDHESQVDDSGTPLFNNRTVVDTPNNYGPYQDFTGANHNEGWRSVQSAGNLIEHTIPLQLQQASSAEITEATPKSGVSCLDTTPEITKSSQFQSDPKPRLGQDLSIGAFQGSADLTIRPPIMDNGTQYQQRSDEWEGLPWPFAPESSMFENIPVTTELNMDSWNTYTAELTFWGTPIIEKSNHVGLP